MSSNTNPHINIAILGPDNHGKTTLAAAISKALPAPSTPSKTYSNLANAPSKTLHATTIRADHVVFETQTRTYTHIDPATHADAIKTLLSGDAQLHGAILVVAAPIGVTPQAREQLRLARLAGVSATVVYLNKCDLVDDEELLEEVETEIREVLQQSKTGPADTGTATEVPIIRGSATNALHGATATATGSLGSDAISRLAEALDTHIPAPEAAESRPFLMAAEDVFPVSGRGMIATGTVERGTLCVGDSLQVLSGGMVLTTTCVGTEMFKRKIDVVQAGETVGVLLRGLRREDVGGGAVLASPGTAVMCSHFTAEVYVVDTDTPLSNQCTARFSFRRKDVEGSVELSGKESVAPGENLAITVKLVTPVVMEEGLHFVFREDGRTLGFGIVASILE
ncbi:elongation factor Tu [Aspergillus crustosus]